VAVLGVDLWIVSPSESLSLRGGEKTIAMLLTLAAGFFVSVLAGAMREARHRSRRAEEAMRAANAAKDQFLAALSHELRAPLTPVMAATDLLLRDRQLPETIRDDLELIRRNVSLQCRLIDDLLDSTRIARGKVELHRQTLPLATVVHHAIQVCAPEVDAKGLNLDVGSACCNIYVHADPARLQQIFWNLLRNAVKFTAPGGRITVRCRTDNGRAIVQVSDTGIGIAPEHLPRIFDAFEQGGREVTRQFGGLGLGLAISRAIVEMHGGTIRASSEGKGQGATFTVELPLASEFQRQSAGAPDRPVSDGTQSLTTAKPLQILLVEDHADTAKMMTRLLSADGHVVVQAGTVSDALNAAASAEFDLLLSDLSLPDGTGLDLIRQLSARGKSLKAIALSGYGAASDIENSREAGFAEHLVKPINIESLQSAILRVAERSLASASAIS